MNNSISSSLHPDASGRSKSEMTVMDLYRRQIREAHLYFPKLDVKTIHHYQ